jgi:DNA-binding MarR family transcriptional regulator
MARVANLAKLTKKMTSTPRPRSLSQRHEYFKVVAQARYIWRKVYRLIEEQAKLHNLDSLEHQALLQVYGSPNQSLRVKELAERLDIAAAFASNLVKSLVDRELLVREADPTDMRVTFLRITETGRELCHRIDEDVLPHVNYFTSQLAEEERERAHSILMFYMNISER